MLDEQPVEEDFVAIEQCDEADEFFQIVALGSEMLQFERDLLVDGSHAGGEEAAEAEALSFFGCEGEVFVPARLAEEGCSGQSGHSTP
ncbi:MAG: hypothetical protein AMXMBFR20_17890 [Planctomycetia bacterium]